MLLEDFSSFYHVYHSCSINASCSLAKLVIFNNFCLDQRPKSGYNLSLAFFSSLSSGFYIFLTARYINVYINTVWYKNI